MGRPTVDEHLGIITQIAVKYWKKLPPHMFRYYEVEDLISELALWVHYRMERYTPQKGKPSTYVTRVAENHCKVMLTHHYAKKRRLQEMTYIDQEPWQIAVNNEDGLCARLLEANDAVELVISESSEELRLVLAMLFPGARPPARLARVKVKPEVKDEFHRLIRKHGATYGDFYLLLSRV